MMHTPPCKRKTCEDMRDSLRKMGRKKSGRKVELEERLCLAQATAAAQNIIRAFNNLNFAEKVYLNDPEVWEAKEPDAAGRKARFLVEPLIKGKYIKFNSNTAYIDEKFHTMQALSHFSFHQSHGKRLLCDLQGGHYDDFYVLTDPVLCSKEQALGATDLGKRGIQNFFAHHRCNHLCNRAWIQPDVAVVHFAPMAGTTFVTRGSSLSDPRPSFLGIRV